MTKTKTAKTRDKAFDGLDLVEADDVRGRSICFLGRTGMGKTTLVSNFPNAVILPAAHEQGAAELKAAGILPDVRQMRAWVTHYDLLSRINEFAEWAESFKGQTTLVIETVQHVVEAALRQCLQDDFAGNDSKKEGGFNHYGAGTAKTKTDYLQPLRDRLDQLRDEGVHIVFTGHTDRREQKNPHGDDFVVEGVTDITEKLWKVFEKWAECVLLYTFEIKTEEGKGFDAAKAKSGTRVILGHLTPTFDGKTRWGLAETVYEQSADDEPDVDGSEMYAHFCKIAGIDPATLRHVD